MDIVLKRDIECEQIGITPAVILNQIKRHWGKLLLLLCYGEVEWLCPNQYWCHKVSWLHRARYVTRCGMPSWNPRTQGRELDAIVFSQRIPKLRIYSSCILPPFPFPSPSLPLPFTYPFPLSTPLPLIFSFSYLLFLLPFSSTSGPSTEDSVVLHPALKPACSSVRIASVCSIILLNRIYYYFTWMADLADIIVLRLL